MSTLSAAPAAAARSASAATPASLDVLINLPGLSDKGYVGKTRRKAADLSARVGTRCAEIYEYVLGRLEKSAD